MQANLVTAKIAIVMGSQNDWSTLQFAKAIFTALNISFETNIASSHNTPDKLFRFVEQAADNGYAVIIAGAGGTADLPNILVTKTLVPVLGVSIQSVTLCGVASIYSIVPLLPSIQVGTLAIAKASVTLLTAQILTLHDVALVCRLSQWSQQKTDEVLSHSDPREQA